MIRESENMIANTCFAYNELMDLKCKHPNISLI